MISFPNKYLAFAIPVAGLVLLSKSRRAKRQKYPPDAEDIHVEPVKQEVYGH